MKLVTILGAATLLTSGAVMADPVADTGLVSVFGGQTAQLNVVNLDPSKSCSFTLSFIAADTTTVTGGILTPPATPTVLAPGEAVTLAVVPATAPTQVRGHIDFVDQLVANAGQLDPMDGCYRLAPTLEVVDGITTQVLNTTFYGMPVPDKDRKPGKVKICHQPGSPAQHTLEVPTTALKGHLGHGDKLGQCPTP